MNVGFCPKCPFHGCPLSLLTSKASKGLVREPGPGTVLSTRQPPLRCLLSWKPTRRDCNQGPPPALSGFDGFGQGEALAGHQRWGGDRGDSEAFLLPPCSPRSSRQWPRFVVAAPAGWPLSWTPAATGDHRVPSPRLLQWRSARRASSWAAAGRCQASHLLSALLTTHTVVNSPSSKPSPAPGPLTRPSLSRCA